MMRSCEEVFWDGIEGMRLAVWGVLLIYLGLRKVEGGEVCWDRDSSHREWVEVGSKSS